MLTATTTSTVSVVRARSRSGGMPWTSAMTPITAARVITVVAPTAAARISQVRGPMSVPNPAPLTIIEATVTARPNAERLNTILTIEYRCQSQHQSQAQDAGEDQGHRRQVEQPQQQRDLGQVQVERLPTHLEVQHHRLGRGEQDEEEDEAGQIREPEALGHAQLDSQRQREHGERNRDDVRDLLRATNG